MKSHLYHKIFFITLACCFQFGCTPYTLNDFCAEHTQIKKGEATMTGLVFVSKEYRPLFTFVTDDGVPYQNLVGIPLEFHPTYNYIGCKFVVWYDSEELSKSEPSRQSYLGDFAYLCLDQLILQDSVPIATTKAKIRKLHHYVGYARIEYEFMGPNNSHEDFIYYRWSECLPLAYYDLLKEYKKRKQYIVLQIYSHPDTSIRYLPRIDRALL